MKIAGHRYAVLLLAAALAGCGGHKSTATVVSTSPQTAPSTTASTSTVAAPPGAPQALAIGGKPAFKIVYTTQSAPNAVTGKRVTLTVDRYYVWKGGKEAIVDLGTPVGVDNVDAYRLMIESFKWK